MITKLTIKNFRCLKDAESPPLTRFNVILGPNGSGKSSIKDALSVLFSGTASGAESGIGLDALRTVGAESKWSITATVDNGGSATRAEGEGPRSRKQEYMEQTTGVSGAKARACIECGEFVRLDAKARQRLLLDIAPQATVPLSLETKGAIAELLRENHEEVDLNTIDRLHKLAYEARAEVARIVKAMGDLDEPGVPEILREMLPDLPDAHEIRSGLATLRTERDTARARAVPGKTDLSPFQWAVDKSERELTRIRDEIGALPTNMEIARLGQEVVNKLRNAALTNADIEERTLALRAELGEADGAMKAAKAALDAIEKQHGSACCPVCNSKLTKTNLGVLATTLRNKYEAAARNRQKINEDLTHVSEPLSIVALQKEAEELSAKESRLAKLRDEEERASGHARECRDALAQAEAEPEPSADPDAAATVHHLDSRIANGEAILEAVVAYEAARKSHQAMVDNKATAMKRHLALDSLVTELGPGGIRSGCGASGMFEFHSDLNVLLAKRGFEVDLRPVMDLTGDALVKIGSGAKVPLGMLSKGERTAFGAAFACAVASYTKFGIVVVDDFESLDPDANGTVQDILFESGHQVFVLCVERDDIMQRAAQSNAESDALRVFFLRDGKLVAPGLEVKA